MFSLSAANLPCAVNERPALGCAQASLFANYDKKFRHNIFVRQNFCKLTGEHELV